MSISKKIAKLSLATICLALSATAHADSVTITLDPHFGSPDYAFYTYTDTAGAVQSNVPVGPYMATLNGGGYNNLAVMVFCYDMAAETDVGTAYTGSVESVAKMSPPTSTEVLDSTYLINELMNDGGIDAPLAQRGAVSLAIWEIMNPTSTTKSTPFPTDPAALPYETQAADAVADGSWTVADADQYQTWMPDDIASIQRFGVSTPAPEPATLVLTGLGLLCFGMIAKRTARRPAPLPGE
jgi:hypothetical protein